VICLLALLSSAKEGRKCKTIYKNSVGVTCLLALLSVAKEGNKYQQKSLLYIIEQAF
jgi:hypothetical protein